MTGTISIETVRQVIEQSVTRYPVEYSIPNFWRSPIAACAPADDRFNILPDIAKPDHSLPEDLLSTGRSVVVFFVPFTKELAKENHKGDIPCRNWGFAYQHTNNLINGICEELKRRLAKSGRNTALVPATHNFDEKTLMARWSHKHIGYVAGLGRFGVNAQLITPKGCAGRLGSFVTEAILGDHPLVTDEELCLYKTEGQCLVCKKRCPVGAVSETHGIDRHKCWARLNENLHHTKVMQGFETTTHVCGKCQVLVPCSLKAP
jgi:epoxyqueuosine reductase